MYPINTRVVLSLGHIENDLCSLIFYKSSVMHGGINEEQWERCGKGIIGRECSLFMIGFEPVLNHSSERGDCKMRVICTMPKDEFCLSS